MAQDLKGKFSEMERLAEERRAAAERLRADMRAQVAASEAVLSARESAVAAAQDETSKVAEELERRNKLIEALRVEVVYADELRGKEKGRRETVWCHEQRACTCMLPNEPAFAHTLAAPTGGAGARRPERGQARGGGGAHAALAEP